MDVIEFVGEGVVYGMVESVDECVEGGYFVGVNGF